jgi:hypothetical protein
VHLYVIITGFTEEASLELTHYSSIRNVLGSNLNTVTEYYDSDLLWFSSVPPDEFRNISSIKSLEFHPKKFVATYLSPAIFR